MEEDNDKRQQRPTRVVRVVRVVASGRAAARRALGLSDIALNVRYGELSEAESETLFARGSGRGPALDDERPADAGAMIAEAARCLVCGCATAEDCRLRRVAAELGADTRRFAGARRPLRRDASHPLLVFEPHKCILCGACTTPPRDTRDTCDATDAAPRRAAALGRVGRGIRSDVAAPYGAALAELDIDPRQAARLAALCPTAALHLRRAGASPDPSGA